MKRFPLTSLIPGLQTEYVTAQFAWHNPNAGVFWKGWGSPRTPLLFSLCYWSCVSVVDHISPTIGLKPGLARKKSKQNKKYTEIRVTARTKTKVQLLCISSPVLGISRFVKSIMVLSSKIIWKKRTVCCKRGEKFCVTMTGVRSTSYSGSLCPGDAGLVCSSVSKAQVSAALPILQRNIPPKFAVKNV